MIFISIYLKVVCVLFSVSLVLVLEERPDTLLYTCTRTRTCYLWHSVYKTQNVLCLPWLNSLSQRPLLTPYTCLYCIYMYTLECNVFPKIAMSCLKYMAILPYLIKLYIVNTSSMSLFFLAISIHLTKVYVEIKTNVSLAFVHISH